MAAATIDILLGVYNGAEHFEATLESIRQQSFEDWHLWVRDDGSTDATPDILLRWQDKLGSRMTIYPNPERTNLKIFGNFSILLAACDAPYVTSAAHDDIYHTDKLAITLEAMRRHEAKVGPQTPIVVYTDQALIDGQSQPIAPSLWKNTAWRPPRGRAFGRLLVHSAIYGGTTLINRSLIKLLGDPPRCDDTWFAWLAAAFGDLVPLDIQTVDFRRHGKNFSELTPMATTLKRLVSQPWQASHQLRERLEELRPQIRHFLDHYRNKLPPEHLAAAQAFLDLPQMNPVARRMAILRHGLFYSSWLRNAGLLVLV